MSLKRSVPQNRQVNNPLVGCLIHTNWINTPGNSNSQGKSFKKALAVSCAQDNTEWHIFIRDWLIARGWIVAGDYFICWLYQVKKDGGATLNVLLTAKIITSWTKRGDEKYLHQFILLVYVFWKSLYLVSKASGKFLLYSLTASAFPM